MLHIAVNGRGSLELWNLRVEVTFQNHSQLQGTECLSHMKKVYIKNVTKAREQPLGFSEDKNTSCLGTYMHAPKQSGPRSCPLSMQALWGLWRRGSLLWAE